MTTTAAASETRTSWAPMVCLALAQVLMSFNVAALPVSLGGMVDDFGVPPTVVSTGIVMYGLMVAALVMTGAKLGQRFGWVLVFRCVIGFFFLAMLLMIVSPTVEFMIAAQALAGASAAIIVPSLVALIAENYTGRQQATAVGSLGSARAASGVSAFLIGGALGTFVGWRPVFMLLAALAVAVFLLSFRLRSDAGDRSVRIDVWGAILIGAAVVLITVGFNNFNAWGPLLAAPGAPFDVLGVSPAPIAVLLGIIAAQGFFVWSRARTRRGAVPLLDLRVLASRQERSAVFALFIIVSLEAALNFTVPLYIQIVQGRSPLATSLAMMPFNLTVFFAALLVVRIYTRLSMRRIAVSAFILSAAALVWLAVVVTNDWETVPTIVGLVLFGIGQGALVTLLFNVLITAAPKNLAGDVGSLRGTTQNLASAVGTALAGAMLVALLSAGIAARIVESPVITDEMAQVVPLSDINFVSNDRLREVLSESEIPDAAVDDAVRINTETRLNALKIGLLVLAGLCSLAIVPASRLPGYRPGDIPDPSPATAGGSE